MKTSTIVFQLDFLPHCKVCVQLLFTTTLTVSAEQLPASVRYSEAMQEAQHTSQNLISFASVGFLF